MSLEIGNIVQLLDSTLDPKHHRKAEAALRIEEKKPQFCLSLLQIASSDLALKTRLAAALCFKNYIRLNYVDEEGAYKLPQEEVVTIKQELVGLMISSPPSIQTQLGEAISIIADSDFWERWDTLIDDLVGRLSGTDYKITNGVLEVAHSIFVRWRPLFRSNELFTEINHVLSKFGEPFIKMLNVVDQQIDANNDNAAVLKGWFESMSLLIKIFYDLSCQDMPPIVESNLQPVTALLQKYLSYSNPVLVADDDDEATVVENVKSDICEALQLYTTKYDDDFGAHTEPFIQSVWSVLSTTGPEKRFDLLVSKALQFLTAVASSARHAANFSVEGTLQEIVKVVILPNVELRESDIEMFEDEPIEFIRRDLEGSDTDSRRRAATDFLRSLLEKHEMLVTKVVFEYINSYLAQGKTDWKAKDTAIYLFLAIAAKGAVTAAQGVKTVNQYVDVVDFFQNNVAADLMGSADTHPIAKVDAIKYLHNFRSQLTKDQWQTAFQPLIQNLGSDNYVVYTYAAIAVERVLFLTNDAGVHLFSREDIQPFAKDLLEHLFSLVERDTSPAKLQENEFLMRCILRVLIVIKDGVVPIVDGILTHLINITNVIKSNPSNPRFYYYHFEAIGALVRYSSSSVGSQLEARLWEPFSFILKEDVSEFVPYVFQIFSALLELNPTLALPDHYKTLIPVLLGDAIWETRGNVPACSRFLAAILPKVKDAIIAENQILPVLEIFGRLFGSKKTEQNALDVLESIVNSIPSAALDPYFTTILSKLFTKLDKSMSDSFKIRFVRFYHLVSAKGAENGFGADFFVRHANKVTEGVDLFKPIYLNFVLPTTGQFARPVDRKLGVISYTKTLCDSTSFSTLYEKGWGLTCNYLLDLLKNPPQVTSGFGDDVNEADVDDIGFGVGYTPLNTCRRGARDDFADVENVQQWVGAFFKEADRRHNGAIAQYVDKRLQPEAKAALAPYLA
ncbi:chromosome segregation protein [Ophiostoma piceae UAMH 11346]|uniref:Chromosome segregation protein n=1 Tax=Ophiostoma piceae (strain UAMH 11346) TaxID=1262450 RepID=S3C7J2_OPHP1|nr:chromosome segregation protein [Ophiostoma piceae UAMH 11346]